MECCGVHTPPTTTFSPVVVRSALTSENCESSNVKRKVAVWKAINAPKSTNTIAPSPKSGLPELRRRTLSADECAKAASKQVRSLVSYYAVGSLLSSPSFRSSSPPHSVPRTAEPAARLKLGSAINVASMAMSDDRAVATIDGRMVPCALSCSADADAERKTRTSIERRRGGRVLWRVGVWTRNLCL